MTNDRTSYESFRDASPTEGRLLRQEELILEVTEALAGALQSHGITRTELANRLGKSKGFVSQLLSGARNLTLRTVADVADALGYRIRVQLERSDADLQPGRIERHNLVDIWNFKCARTTTPSFRRTGPPDGRPRPRLVRPAA